MASIRPGIASFGDYFPREYSMEKSRRCGRRALLLLWCLYLRCCFGRLPRSAGKRSVVLLRNWQIVLYCVLLDVLLAADCWLIISSELFRAGRPDGLSSGYLRILWALVLRLGSHRCDIWFDLQKYKNRMIGWSNCWERLAAWVGTIRRESTRDKN